MLAAVMLVGSANVWGQVTLPHYDPINYTVGDALQTQTSWSSVNSGDNVLVASDNLSYSGLSASSGNKITFDGTGIEAVKAFTSQNSGTVYYSFLLNVSSLGSLNTTGGYFTAFTPATNNTDFGASVWLRKSGDGYNVGLNARTTVANTQWSSTVLDINTTYFIVISYQIVSGTLNDVVKLWLNPVPGNSEPAHTLTHTNPGPTANDLATLGKIILRQDAVTTTPFIQMDELRIATTWADVTPPAVPDCTPHGMSFDEDTVYKTLGDPPFTNHLNIPNNIDNFEQGYYTSSNTDVATVATVDSDNGLVTIVGTGTTIISSLVPSVPGFCTTPVTYTLIVTAPSYSVTVSTNNEDYGLVGIDGNNTITVIPEDCYEYTYAVNPAGAATVTPTANPTEFTVSNVTENCNVEFTFTQIPDKTVTLYNNGTLYGSALTSACGAAVTLPTAPTPSCSDYVFVGWKKGSELSAQSAQPADLITDATYTPTETSENLYAVYKRSKKLAELTYDELVMWEVAMPSNYNNVKDYTNLYGIWNFKGQRTNAQVGYIQITGDFGTVNSHIQLPSITETISSIVVSVTNGSGNAYGNNAVLLRDNLTSGSIGNSGTTGDNIRTIIPEAQSTTGNYFLTAGNTCRISNIVVYNETYTSTLPSCESYLTVSPAYSLLKFGTLTMANTPNTKDLTFNISGENISDNITFAISGANESQFSIIEPDAALTPSGNKVADTQVKIRYSSANAATDDVATLTVTCGSITKQISLTGKTVLPVPDVTVSKSLIPFGNVHLGQSATETFTVTGSNLTSNITLSAPVDVAFTLSAHTLSKGADLVGSVAETEITVTYAPTTGTAHSASITISTATGAPQTVNLTGTSTIDSPVAKPAIEIGQTSFKANWNAVSGADHYLLYVYKKGNSIEEGITNGGFEAENLDDWTFDADLNQEISTAQVHSGNNSLYINATQSSSNRQFYQISSLSVGEQYTLSFWYYLDNTSSGNGFRVWTTTGATIQLPSSSDYFTTKGEWVKVEYNFTPIQSEVYFALRFYKDCKVYLDEFSITREFIGNIPLEGYDGLSVSGTSQSVSIPDNENYYYKVLAVDDVGNESALSNEIEIQYYIYLTENTTISETIDYDYKNIIVRPGVALTIDPDVTLTANTLTLESDETGGATFFNNGGTLTTVAANGQIYTFKTSVDNRYSWYVGSPVSAAPYTVLRTGSNNPWKYIEANDNSEDDDWSANDGWLEVNSGTLTAGVGYNVYLNPNDIYSLRGGMFNDGEFSLPLTCTSTNTKYKGFNLIANPYPSYLNLSGLNFTNIEPTIWKRTWNGSDMFYETQNYASGESVPAAAAGNIAPMQGFWLRATAATVLTLTNSMREHKGESGALRINSNRSRLRLNISNGSKTDQMLVYFDNNASNAFDNFDSRKLSNDNAVIPEIYTVTDNVKLVINGMSAVTNNLEIPLGVKLGAAGQFTITATEISNFAGYDIILKDNLLQAEINLSESDYPFASAAIDNTERFSIIFRAPTEVNFVQSSKFKVQSLNGQIVINNARAGDKVEIFTTLGQKLYEQTLNSPFSTLHFPLHTGVYLVKSGNETVKVIVK